MTGAIDRALARKWFYSFELPDGRRTRSYLPEDVLAIHSTRLAMVDAALDSSIDRAWRDVTCLDLACHEGFFAVHLATRGARDVLGIDARRENIEGARLMGEIFGLQNLRLEVANVHELDVTSIGQFDVVLMLGLLYHLSDPIGALRIARSLTREVCLVETQLGPNVSGIIDWGSVKYPKEILGAFVVVDESVDIAAANREAGTDSISLVPSLEALLLVMKAVGFAKVEVVATPGDAYEQFAAGKRVLVKAFPSS